MSSVGDRRGLTGKGPTHERGRTRRTEPHGRGRDVLFRTSNQSLVRENTTEGPSRVLQGRVNSHDTSNGSYSWHSHRRPQSDGQPRRKETVKDRHIGTSLTNRSDTEEHFTFTTITHE